MIPGRTLTRKHIAGRDSRQAFRDRKRSYLLIHSSYDRRLGDYERLWSCFSRNRKNALNISWRIKRDRYDG